MWAENTQTRLFIGSSEPSLITICTKLYNVLAEIITSHQKVNQNHSPVQYGFNRKMNVFKVLKNILGFCQNMFYEWEGFFLHSIQKYSLTVSSFCSLHLHHTWLISITMVSFYLFPFLSFFLSFK